MDMALVVPDIRLTSIPDEKCSDGWVAWKDGMEHWRIDDR